MKLLLGIPVVEDESMAEDEVEFRTEHGNIRFAMKSGTLQKCSPGPWPWPPRELQQRINSMALSLLTTSPEKLDKLIASMKERPHPQRALR